MGAKAKVKRLLGLGICLISYLFVFFLVEQRVTRIHVIHTKMDDLIPFCKYFIIPYALWFPFVAGTILFFAFRYHNEEEYRNLIGMLFIGIMVFLICSLVYPNGQRLRPYLSGNDIFTQAVRFLYRIDTPTNIFPSLHVYNAVACTITIGRAAQEHGKRWISVLFDGFTMTIIMSTMFLKQHSAVDVTAALALILVAYQIVYKQALARYREGAEEKRKRRLVM